MSKALAGVDRVIFFILGLVLIALGLWPILVHFNVEFARYLALWIDHDAWASVPNQQWWPWALGGGAAVAALLGILLIWLNVRGRKINKVDSIASADDGSVVMALGPITAAIAEGLEQDRAIVKAERTVAYDREQRQLSFTLTAKPQTSLRYLNQLINTTETDFRAAFPDSDLHTVYKVHYDRVTT